MTSEAVMHPDDECRPVAWQPRPPLQLGDAVWVRAVVCRISGELQDRAYVTMPHADSPVCHYPFEVPLSAIRRIEGEVKP